jgi:hypothetical protein
MEIENIEFLSINELSNFFTKIKQNYNLLLNENKILKEKIKKNLSIRETISEIKQEETIYISQDEKNNTNSTDDNMNSGNNNNQTNYNIDLNINEGNIPNENYDFIVQITRIIDLFDVGWDYYCSKNFEKFLKDSSINYLIGIFGDKYSGKSFVLRKLINKNITYKGNLIPSLSFKIFKDSFVIFETISTNLPIYNHLMKINKIDKNLSNEEKEKREIESHISSKLNELFIRDYIFQLSNACIYVINILGYNELEKLIEIEKNFKSKLLVIHNLYMINSLEKINNYYNKILMIQKKNLKSQQINNTDYYFYYEEIKYEERKNKTIIHLILGNDNVSEVKSYNQEIIKFIKLQIQSSMGKEINFFNNFQELLQNFIIKYFNVMENNLLHSSIINDINLFTRRHLELKNNKMFYNNKNLNNLHIRFKNISVNYYNGQYREKNTKIIKEYKIYITEKIVSIEFNPEGDISTEKITTNIKNNSFEEFIIITGLYNKKNQQNNEYIFNNIQIYDKFILIIGKEKFDKFFLNNNNRIIEKIDNNNIIIKFEILIEINDKEYDSEYLGNL